MSTGAGSEPGRRDLRLEARLALRPGLVWSHSQVRFDQQIQHQEMSLLDDIATQQHPVLAYEGFLLLSLRGLALGPLGSFLHLRHSHQP